MISAAAFAIFKWLVIISLVIFVLFHLFSDPAGSAAFVSSVIGGIVHGIKAIIVFATNVHA